MIRSNSTEPTEAEGGLARRHRAVVFAAALAASACCFALVPADSLVGSIAQTALLAAVALVAVGLSRPGALGAPRHGVCRGLRALIGYVLAVGLAAGAVTVVGPCSGEVLAGGVLRIVQVVALCFLTGVFEEGVFRVLAIDAFAPAFGGGRSGLLKAAIASSAVFGLLHVSVGDAGLANDAVSVAQMALKPVQAGLFGLFMAAVYVGTRNLWVLVGVHAAFNMLHAGPVLLADGVQQTYVTGAPLDLVLLAATTLLLIPPAVRAFSMVRGSRA